MYRYKQLYGYQTSGRLLRYHIYFSVSQSSDHSAVQRWFNSMVTRTPMGAVFAVCWVLIPRRAGFLLISGL